MSVAPFIRPIQTQGGTFYTFSSAAQDLGFTFNNDGKQFKFSKYALLKLPNIQRPTYGVLNYENYMQLDAIPGAFEYVTNAKTWNLNFAESLENYVLNLETLMMNQSTYDTNDLQTVSERVFFKWLKETGALRFREASQNESPLTAGLRFTEEATSTNYSRVVQYIGDVDMVNSMKHTADAYSEIYINVPTKDGSTPLVLFKSQSDANYFAGQNLINMPVDPINTDFLYGRSFSDVNPVGLDTHAFYDSRVQTLGASAGLTAGGLPSITTPGEYQLLKYDTGVADFTVGWWFPYPEAASYWTQPPAITGSFDDSSNDSLMIRGVKDGSVLSQDIFLQRSRLDGICLDFNTSSYTPIASNPAIQSFSDFNSLPETVSFEFNAVLLYYDVTDVSDPSKTATNLFGVLFLDEVQDQINGSGLIPPLAKYKPNTITGLNGNAFGFKVNLKFDINDQQTSVVTAVNEYAPFSMQVFLEALNQIQTAADSLLTSNNLVQQLQTQVSELTGLIYSQSTLTDLDNRVDTIESQIATSNAMLENSSTLMDLIKQNYDEILNIYKNVTSVKIAYNLDVLVQGAGVLLDKSVPNQVTLSNIEQSYTVDSNSVVSVLSSFVATPQAWTNFRELKTFGNYMKLSNGSNVVFDRNVNIYIDDSNIQWKSGQTFKLVVDHLFPMDMYTQGSFDLVIYTDSMDRLNTGVNYSAEIARIYSSDFYLEGGSPIIEIICLDPINYTFTFDLQ